MMKPLPRILMADVDRMRGNNADQDQATLPNLWNKIKADATAHKDCDVDRSGPALLIPGRPHSHTVYFIL